MSYIMYVYVYMCIVRAINAIFPSELGKVHYACFLSFCMSVCLSSSLDIIKQWVHLHVDVQYIRHIHMLL